MPGVNAALGCARVCTHLCPCVHIRVHSLLVGLSHTLPLVLPSSMVAPCARRSDLPGLDKDTEVVGALHLQCCCSHAGGPEALGAGICGAVSLSREAAASRKLPLGLLPGGLWRQLPGEGHLPGGWGPGAHWPPALTTLGWQHVEARDPFQEAAFT